MYLSDVLREHVKTHAKTFSRANYFTFILMSLIFMCVALIYVWSHIRATELEYRIAEEIGIKETLLEEQRRLKVELATLKSPRRIETIAREKLDMTFPEREQIIIIKHDPGRAAQ